ncbi:hypothetical protein ABWK22_00410, partial [Gottfriedia acidiceleris]
MKILSILKCIKNFREREALQKIKKHKIYLLAFLLPFVLFVIGFELGPMIAMIKNGFYADDGIHLTMNQYIT